MGLPPKQRALILTCDIKSLTISIEQTLDIDKSIDD